MDCIAARKALQGGMPSNGSIIMKENKNTQLSSLTS